jgi:hypothetical protein
MTVQRAHHQNQAIAALPGKGQRVVLLVRLLSHACP